MLCHPRAPFSDSDTVSWILAASKASLVRSSWIVSSPFMECETISSPSFEIFGIILISTSLTFSFNLFGFFPVHGSQKYPQQLAYLLIHSPQKIRNLNSEHCTIAQKNHMSRKRGHYVQPVTTLLKASSLRNFNRSYLLILFSEPSCSLEWRHLLFLLFFYYRF